MKITTFTFQLGISNSTSDYSNIEDGLLLDYRATTYIVHDITKFIRFDKHFNLNIHYIELANGSRANKMAWKRGDACVQLCDVNVNVRQAILTNTLYVPPCKQNIYPLFRQLFVKLLLFVFHQMKPSSFTLMALSLE